MANAALSGTCAVTQARSGCRPGAVKGSWTLPLAATTWPGAAEACLRLCHACAPCKFVSFSLRHEDCSWFSSCATRMAAPAFVTLPSDATMTTPATAFNFPKPVQRPFTRRQTARATSTGAWVLDDGYEYLLDGTLANATAALLLSSSLRRPMTLLDVGAGTGHYVRALSSHGLTADGVDGAHGIGNVSGGWVTEHDVTQPFCRPHDWVLSLEVAEHVPAAHEATYLDGLVCSARDGLVLSWALAGGNGHVNRLAYRTAIEHIEAAVARASPAGGPPRFVYRPLLSLALCERATIRWLRSNVIVFTRPGLAALRPPWARRGSYHLRTAVDARALALRHHAAADASAPSPRGRQPDHAPTAKFTFLGWDRCGGALHEGSAPAAADEARPSTALLRRCHEQTADSGVVRLSGALVDECLHLCSSCAHCHFVSVLPSAGHCAWYSRCSPSVHEDRARGGGGGGGGRLAPAAWTFGVLR